MADDDSGVILAVLTSRFDGLEESLRERFADVKANMERFVLDAVYTAHREADRAEVEAHREAHRGEIEALKERQDAMEADSGTNWRTLLLVAVPAAISIIALLVTLTK